MKTILTLVASLSLLGCGKHFPSYPQNLRDFHLVEIVGQQTNKRFAEMVENIDQIPAPKTGESIRCLKFKVTHINPFRFEYIGTVTVDNCHQVAGYKPDENVILWNWIDDVLKSIDEAVCVKKAGE